MIILPVGIQEKPPLLQMYILPSGPSAAPLGPPGISATTCLRPSGQTRVSLLPRISTSTTEPSGITTGPSGNSRSVAMTRILAMKSSRLASAAGGFQIDPARATFRCSSYGKVAWACQPDGLRNRYYRSDEGLVVWSIPVIASEAKQSIALGKGRMDCFVASLPCANASRL